jgi:succinate dehydrogenase / fumarate reductase, membrane anchor subunit
MKVTSIRTPLGRVRGLGSAKSGTEHWWEMRLTAVALVPLVLAAIIIVISLIGRNHAAVVQILGSPLVAIVMLLFIYTTTLHMRLGLQSVIEDYVHGKGMKTALLIANTFLTIVLWLACTYAILKLSFGV